jgi:hypothetical protein
MYSAKAAFTHFTGAFDIAPEHSSIARSTGKFSAKAAFTHLTGASESDPAQSLVALSTVKVKYSA